MIHTNQFSLVFSNFSLIIIDKRILKNSKKLLAKTKMSFKVTCLRKIAENIVVATLAKQM